MSLVDFNNICCSVQISSTTGRHSLKIWEWKTYKLLLYNLFHGRTVQYNNNSYAIIRRLCYLHLPLPGRYFLAQPVDVLVGHELQPLTQSVINLS